MASINPDNVTDQVKLAILIELGLVESNSIFDAEAKRIIENYTKDIAPVEQR